MRNLPIIGLFLFVACPTPAPDSVKTTLQTGQGWNLY